MTIPLGSLEKVDLRAVWNHEALDFTKWLAREENIEILGNEIGIDIDFDSIKTEEAVGDFNVDILAEEENTEKKIIIENQLEATNHDHLGKILTYASGHDAKIIVWIVKQVREEHQKAIDWLNEHTDEDIAFFLVQMELWKIGNSLPAPKFSVISQPNDWAKEVKKAVESSDLSETKKLQLSFWNKFKEFAERNHTKLRLREARPHHWYDLAIGSSRAHMTFTINTQDNSVACEIYIGHDKELFGLLEAKKDAIERELQTNLDWMELPHKKASRIKLSSNINIKKEENLEVAFNWLQEWGEKFQKVFYESIKEVE